MKTQKCLIQQILSLVLSFLMAMSIAVPALAATGNKVENQSNLTITIKNNEGLPEMKDDQFSAFQLFVGTPHEETPSSDPNKTENEWNASNWNNYSLADIKWGKDVEGSDLLTGLQTEGLSTDEWPHFFEDGKSIFAKYKEGGKKLESASDLADFLVGKDNAFLQEFCRFLLEGSKEGTKGAGLLKNKDTVSKSDVSYDADDPKDDESSITVDSTGYYLIVENGDHTSSDAVSEYILAVLGDQIIDLKASVPTTDKDFITSETTDAKGDVAGVGDYVQFKLTGTLPKNIDEYTTYQYIFHDTLSKGLDFVKDENHPVAVRIYESQQTADAGNGVKDGFEVPQGKYTVNEPGTEDAEAKCSLEVAFKDLKSMTDVKLTKDSVIVVTYYAKVNKDAIIGSAGNSNTAVLEYSNDPNHDSTGKTTEKIVYVYVFGLDLVKVGNDDAGKEGLDGAGFVLTKKKADGSVEAYAIFEDQYVLDVKTTKDGIAKTEKSFFDNKEAADAAAAKAKEGTDETTTVETSVTGPVRRLTGWTSDSSEPNTTEVVTGLTAAYKEAKKAVKDASSKEKAQAEEKLAQAKTALTDYLLESKTENGKKGIIPYVYGLDGGKYYLKEVITPDGYNTMDDFDIEITPDINPTAPGELRKITYRHGTEEKIYTSSDDAAINGVFTSGLLPQQLVNIKAPFLPFTGGKGTLIFSVLGCALIAGAVVYLVIASKRRKKFEANA